MMTPGFIYSKHRGNQNTAEAYQQALRNAEEKKLNLLLKILLRNELLLTAHVELILLLQGINIQNLQK